MESKLLKVHLWWHWQQLEPSLTVDDARCHPEASATERGNEMKGRLEIIVEDHRQMAQPSGTLAVPRGPELSSQHPAGQLTVTTCNSSLSDLRASAVFYGQLHSRGTHSF